MDPLKKRIPEKILADLVLHSGCITAQELRDCLDRQRQLRESGVEQGLEDIFADTEILALEKSRCISSFVDFTKIRWNGMVFGQVAIQRQKISAEDLPAVLVTQRAIYSLKQKTVAVDELLLRKDRLSQKDIDEIAGYIKELSLTEYELLLEKALEYLLKEDGAVLPDITPPPSKLEGPPAPPVTKGRTDFILPEQDYVSVAPPSKFQDEFDIERTAPERIPQPLRRRNFLPYLIAFVVGALALGILSLVTMHDRNREVDAVSVIRDAMRDKEYVKVEKYCREFRQNYPQSPYHEETTRIWQQVLLKDAGIFYRQGREQKIPEKLTEAQAIIPKLLQLGEKTRESERARSLLAEIEKTSRSLKAQREFTERTQNIRQLIKQRKWEQAKRGLEDFREWAGNCGEDLKADQFSQWGAKTIEAEEERDRVATYRYYPANELGKDVISPPADTLPEGISLRPLPLAPQGAPSGDAPGNFFMTANGYLYALNASDGRIQWMKYLGESAAFYPLFIAGFREYSNMNLVDRLVVSVPRRNTLSLIHAATGETQWEKVLPSTSCVQPVLYRDKIYAGCLDHYCYQIEISTGSLKGAYLARGIPEHPPVFDRRGEAMYLYCRGCVYGYSLITGRLTLEIKAADLVAPVVAVYPYLYLFTGKANQTSIYPYLLTQDGPQLLAIEPPVVPGVMRSPANLSGGTMAVATDSHLALFEVNPGDPLKILVPFGDPIPLRDRDPAQMRCSNAAQRELVRRLIVAQENLSVWEGFEIPGESEIKRIAGYSGSMARAHTFLPLQKCGPRFFWAQVSPENRYSGTCIDLGDPAPAWQVKPGLGVHVDPVVTGDSLLVMDQGGDIYEIGSREISCRLLAEKAGDGYIPILSSGEDLVLVTGKSLRLFNFQGQKTAWQPRVSFQGELGRAACQKSMIAVGTTRGVFVLSSESGDKVYEEFTVWPPNPFYGTPVFYRNSIAIGCDDGNLYKLEFTPGTPPYLQNVWSFPTHGQVRSTPLLAGDTLYFGSQDRSLYAVDMKAHRELWRFATQGAVVGKPAIRKDVLCFGSCDRHLYAVSAGTGKLLWKRELAGQIKAAPLIYQGKVYAASIAGELCAFDLREGKELWRIPLGGQILASPAVVGDTIIVASTNGLVYFLKDNSSR